MQNTVYEFWLMVLQNIQKVEGRGIQKIAMLTDFIESARPKCAVYFPSEVDDDVVFTSTNSSQHENLVRERLDKIFDPGKEYELDEAFNEAQNAFNFFVVKNVGLKQKNGYSIRKLRLHYGSSQASGVQRHDLFHYWFPDWPDHRSPQDIDVLLDMSLDLLDLNCSKDFDEEVTQERGTNPLPIIHCSAGIGRTGCLAAILNGLGQMRSCSDDVSVDVLGIVCNLRLQRGGMVQNSEQYELIHRSLCLYQEKISQK
jgi:tyrosine-protein phosphatase ERK